MEEPKSQHEPLDPEIQKVVTPIPFRISFTLGSPEYERERNKYPWLFKPDGTLKEKYRRKKA